MAKTTMKFGTEVGNVINWVMSANPTEPEVGKGATVLMWSDRQAYQVVEVNGDKTEVKIQRIIGDEQQGIVTTLVRRKNGWYSKTQEVHFVKGVEVTPQLVDSLIDNANPGSLRLEKGVTYLKTCYNKMNIIFGVAENYTDPSF